MSGLRTIVGIDPDTKSTGFCVLREQDPTRYSIEFKIANAGGHAGLAEDRREEMARAIRETMRVIASVSPSPSHVAIEFHHIRPREVNPNSIMAIQAVAGIALAVTAFGTLAQIHVPIPSEWKGTVPKEIHQKRILEEAGLTIDSPEFSHIPRSKRTHCIDALGLCLWVRRGCKIR